MKIAWIHSFPLDKPASGVFMHLLVGEIRKMGIQIELVYVGGGRRVDRFLLSPGALRDLVKGCDIIHAQYGSACGFATSMIGGAKMLTLRGSDWYGLKSKRPSRFLKGVAGRWLTIKSLGRFDIVLTMSRRMQREIKALAGVEARVLPDAVDLERFRPMDRYEARCRIGQGKDSRPWVLFCMWEPDSGVKRLHLAREVTQRARKKIPGLQLKILTGKPHCEMPLWINASNAVLLTSTHEGWPNVIKEALACNLPFVSTDVSDLSMIADIEPSCHVVDSASVDELSQCLVETLRAENVQTLRRHVEDMSLSRVAKELCNMYDKLLIEREQNV